MSKDDGVVTKITTASEQYLRTGDPRRIPYLEKDYLRQILDEASEVRSEHGDRRVTLKSSGAASLLGRSVTPCGDGTRLWGQISYIHENLW